MLPQLLSQNFVFSTCPHFRFSMNVKRSHHSSTVGDSRTGRRLRRASNLLTWSDVELDRSSALQLDGSLAVLPVPLLRDRVFGFLAPPPTAAFISNELQGFDLDRYQSRLATVRSVCQQWFKLAQFLVAESKRFIVRIPIEPKNFSGRRRVMELAAASGDQSIELRFETDSLYEYSCRLRTPASEKWLIVFFGRFTILLLLDISRVWNRVAVDALELASRFCPQVIALRLCSALPVRVSDDYLKPSEIALRSALKLWHESNGGLRSLSVPNWALRGNTLHTFLLDVAAHCPRLENIIISYPTFPLLTTRSLATAKRPIVAPLSAWKSFYTCCLSLRCLSINESMFSRDHLSLVTALPASRIDTVEIVIESNLWHELPGFNALISLVSALPRLRSFLLDFKFYTGGGSMDKAQCQDLVQHMATHCLHLERLHIQIVWASYMAGTSTIDEGAITQLILRPSIQWVTIGDFKLGHENGSLLSLFKKIISSPSRPLLLDLNTRSPIHSAVMDLLEYIGQSGHLWKPRKIEFHIHSSSSDPPTALPDKIETLVTNIKQSLGTALSFIYVLVRPHLGNQLSTIEALSLMIKVPRSRTRANFPTCTELEARGGVYGGNGRQGNVRRARVHISSM